LFNVSVCIVELAFIRGQLRQRTMNPKQLITPFKSGRDFEGFSGMVNGLLSLAL